jgi:beta-galactosidase beta subunit
LSEEKVRNAGIDEIPDLSHRFEVGRDAEEKVEAGVGNEYYSNKIEVTYFDDIRQFFQLPQRHCTLFFPRESHEQ